MRYYMLKGKRIDRSNLKTNTINSSSETKEAQSEE